MRPPPSAPPCPRPMRPTYHVVGWPHEVPPSCPAVPQAHAPALEGQGVQNGARPGLEAAQSQGLSHTADAHTTAVVRGGVHCRGAVESGLLKFYGLERGPPLNPHTHACITFREELRGAGVYMRSYGVQGFT